MPALHQEISFETEICEHLAANGWLHAEGDAAGYDRGRALFPADVVAWVASLANQTGVDLSAAVERYAHGCPRCGGSPCTCP